MRDENVYYYPKKEEQFNIASHAFGIFLSIIGLGLLFYKSLNYSFIQAGSYIVYGFSQILIFSASTYYHAQTDAKKRYYANIADHAFIYISIAGTYTPFCLITLKADHGWLLLLLVWTFAAIGFVLKIFYTGKYNLFSTLMYLLMGWMIIFFWNEIMKNLALNGVYLLILGGVFYTVGALFYMLEKTPYNHAIFHVFILLGAISHYLSIFLYT